MIQNGFYSLIKCYYTDSTASIDQASSPATVTVFLKYGADPNATDRV